MDLQIQTSMGKSRKVAGQFMDVQLKDRIQRSAQGAGIGLGLALLSLPLPAVHFVLVPSFLIFAVYSGNKKLNEKFKVEFHEAKCPECGQPLKDSKIFSKEPRFRIQCYECKSQLHLHALPFSAAKNESTDHSQG
ncbi:MAG: hypothetical protein ACAH59_00075 [Pseudobdellovibrionaceae bacterium]